MMERSQMNSGEKCLIRLSCELMSYELYCVVLFCPYLCVCFHMHRHYLNSLCITVEKVHWCWAIWSCKHCAVKY